jgi:hypothetical protein
MQSTQKEKNKIFKLKRKIKQALEVFIVKRKKLRIFLHKNGCLNFKILQPKKFSRQFY